MAKEAARSFHSLRSITQCGERNKLQLPGLRPIVFPLTFVCHEFKISISPQLNDRWGFRRSVSSSVNFLLFNIHSWSFTSMDEEHFIPEQFEQTCVIIPFIFIQMRMSCTCWIWASPRASTLTLSLTHEMHISHIPRSYKPRGTYMLPPCDMEDNGLYSTPPPGRRANQYNTQCINSIFSDRWSSSLNRLKISPLAPEGLQRYLMECSNTPRVTKSQVASLVAGMEF